MVLCISDVSLVVSCEYMGLKYPNSGKKPLGRRHITDTFKTFKNPNIMAQSSLQRDPSFGYRCAADQVCWDYFLVDQAPAAPSATHFVGAGAESGSNVIGSICLIWWKCGNTFILCVTKFYLCMYIYILYIYNVNWLQELFTLAAAAKSGLQCCNSSLKAGEANF